MTAKLAKNKRQRRFNVGTARKDDREQGYGVNEARPVAGSESREAQRRRRQAARRREATARGK